ncbi:prohibitin family protein, partial [Bacillus thuringiensis]|nr:prohibitin family protein [Bacillus thuringiensis]
NEIIKKSLTPEIVEIKKIEKWDGKLPQVSGEANPMIQVK